ncbi:alpha/beta hydrolase [Planctomycetota bacterium]|nr:alpha/beta hydrolase [Planctomycetota bacterium]
MIEVRKYGVGIGGKAKEVLVLHGGPAAAGSATPLAQKLMQDGFRVYEPMQRDTSRLAEGQTLSVQSHVDDLHEVIRNRCDYGSVLSGGNKGKSARKPILVGHSWGAMLALAYAAQYPEVVGPIVLVGCGTYSEQTRNILKERIQERIDTEHGLAGRLARLDVEVENPQKRANEKHRLTERLYCYAKLGEDVVGKVDVEFDLRAHEQTWHDMMRMQAEGAYPKAFEVIKSPVLMIHGAHDPHPGIETYELLKQSMPQLDYHELERCGHSPWAERYARTEFFSTMRGWLAGRK